MGHNYCTSQLYAGEDTLAMNQSHLNFQPPSKLAYQDELIYKTYLEYMKKSYIPPIEIKEHRVKGFYAVAIQFLKANTLLCEYVGEVVTRKQGQKYHSDNDSIMSLIVD